MANLRILSYNAQGLQGSEKRIDVFGLNMFISENNIHGNYNYCYIYKHNRIRTKAI